MHGSSIEDIGCALIVFFPQSCVGENIGSTTTPWKGHNGAIFIDTAFNILPSDVAAINDKGNRGGFSGDRRSSAG